MTAHLLHGIAIVVLRFSSLDQQARHALVRWWANKMLRVLGIGVHGSGELHPGPVLLAANHVSWLDIVVIHAVCPQARFISKSEVRHWPLLRTLVDAAGTLYLERDRRRDALRVVHLMAEALGRGDTLVVFPEGTTGEGPQPLPFHANLLQAAVAVNAKVQPVALRFSDRKQAFSPAVAYVGDTSLLQSLWWVVCAEGLQAHLTLLPSQAAAGAERRALAAALRERIEAELKAVA
ncbi:MAG TPA: lysophospholipid acyltransferase family protein [Methylibium sp.]